MWRLRRGRTVGLDVSVRLLKHAAAHLRAMHAWEFDCLGMLWRVLAAGDFKNGDGTRGAFLLSSRYVTRHSMYFARCANNELASLMMKHAVSTRCDGKRCTEQQQQVQFDASACAGWDESGSNGERA